MTVLDTAVRRWTTDEDAALRRMCASGETESRIAEALDRTQKGVSWRKAVLGVRTSRTLERTRVLDFLASGPASAGEIADHFEKRPPTVRKMMMELRDRNEAFCEGQRGPEGAVWVSFAWWMEKNWGMVHRTAKRVHAQNGWCEYADIVSEVCHSVIHCVRTFRVMGFKFTTYAFVSAERNTKSWAAAQKYRGVHIPQNIVFRPDAIGVSVSDPPESPSGSDPSGFGWLEGREADPATVGPRLTEDVWEKVARVLNEKEAKCLIANFRHGVSYRVLGEELGVSKERIRQIVSGAFKKIRRCRVLAEFAPEVTRPDPEDE